MNHCMNHCIWFQTNLCTNNIAIRTNFDELEFMAVDFRLKKKFNLKKIS